MKEIKKPYYITTPLYYVNDKPHIGHAYTNVLCDTMARFMRFQGREVYFMTGTDEHGEKIDKSAKRQGVDTMTFIEGVVPRFRDLWTKLDITYDYFIRTTDADHKASVARMIAVLEKNGDIYKGQYSGWYCTPCESFWTTAQLVEARCPDCRREVSQIKEENFFFRMSKYQDWLNGYIAEHPSFVRPDHHRREVMSFLSKPLDDLCITRPKSRLSWGIAYPGSADHVLYVWFEALLNYITGIGYGRDEARFNLLWPADLQMVGKDILRHHAVYWPIMLHAAGLAMPKTIFAHGWWTISGSKVSKSLGNIVDPFDVVSTYGTDGLRYYYLHEVTLGSDGAYSEALLTERYNKDLADDLGNLVRRSLSMLKRYTGGVYPYGVSRRRDEFDIRRIADGLGDRIAKRMNAFQFREAVDEIWMLVRSANRFIEQQKPWALAKDPKRTEELNDVLAALVESLRIIGIALTPFLPVTAKRILSQLHLSTTPTLDDLACWGVFKAGAAVEEPSVLFPKIQPEDIAHG